MGVGLIDLPAESARSKIRPTAEGVVLGDGLRAPSLLGYRSLQAWVTTPVGAQAVSLVRQAFGLTLIVNRYPSAQQCRPNRCSAEQRSAGGVSRRISIRRGNRGRRVRWLPHAERCSALQGRGDFHCFDDSPGLRCIRATGPGAWPSCLVLVSRRHA